MVYRNCSTIRKHLLIYQLAVFSSIIFALAATAAEFKPSVKNLQRIEDHFFEYMPQDVESKNFETLSQASRVNGNLGESGYYSPKDGSPLDFYEFSGSKGDVVRVLVSSNDFDPVAWIVEAENEVLLEGGDDSEDGWNAMFKTVLPRTGSYWVAVNSYGSTGHYELRLEWLAPFQIPEDSILSKKRALLIGINDYFGAERDLSAPVHDVDLMKELLVSEAGFSLDSVLLIKDHDATLENIAEAVNSFLGTVPEDGIAVLYYSGHGIQLSANNDLESDKKDEALIFADASYLLDDELHDLIGCLSSSKVVVIVDSCYSGGIDRGTGQKFVPERQVKKYLDIAGRRRSNIEFCGNNEIEQNKTINLLIAAAQEHELAWEWPYWESLPESRSVFTNYFVEGISTALRDNPDTLIETVLNKISQNTTQFTQNKFDSVQEGKIVDSSRRTTTLRNVFSLEVE